MESSLKVLARKSREGDKNALEELIRRIQGRVYGLSLRMLYHPVDAEDVAQEILLKYSHTSWRFSWGERIYHLDVPHCHQSPAKRPAQPEGV